MNLASASRVLLFLVSLLPLAGAGCGASPEDACKQYADAICNFLQRCSSATLNLTYGDMATCTARQQQGCSYSFPPGSANSPADVITCASALPNAACDQGTNITECRPKPGHQGFGSLCLTDGQCESGFCLKAGGGGFGGGMCGTCAQRGKLGEDCDVTTCDFDLVCKFNANSPNVCVTPVMVGQGQMCGNEKRCTTGLVCLGQANPVCQPILKQGDTCVPGASACDSANGLYCDTLSMKCVATVYAKTFQPCGAASPTPVTCGGSSRCTSGGMGGFCAGPSGDGQRCTGSYSCLPPASCVSGLCTFPDAAFCE